MENKKYIKQMQKQIIELKKYIVQLENQIKDYRKTNENLLDKNKLLSNYYETLKKDIIKLENKLEENERDKKLLIALLSKEVLK